MEQESIKSTILVVEPNDQDFFLLNKLFLDLGRVHLIRRSKSLVELEEQLIQEEPDFVLLDMGLPRIGEKLGSILEEFSAVPVVLLAEIVDDKRSQRLIQLGAQEVLPKRGLTAEILKRVIRNAIEHKQIEQNLLEINQLKSDFISLVSHELRSPLTYIKESISTVLCEQAGPITEDQKRFLELSEKGVERLYVILNELLDMTKIEAGRMELQVEESDLTALADEAISMFYKQFMDKGIDLKVQHSEKHLILPIDKHRIMQVFTNLLGNAYKFTDKGAVILTLVEHQDYVECTVADSGRGISKEDLPQLFQSFRQFGKSNGGGQEGSGLGLKISRDLIELHHGTMRVESELNKGTRFIFTLPKKNTA